MAYRLKAQEQIAAGLKRIILEEIHSAAGKLAKSSDDERDEAFHEARKSIKKLRGVLRLMRPALGSDFAKENRRFQKLGHDLGDLRDAAALLEMFEEIRKKHAADLDSGAAESIRRGLERDKKDLQNKRDPADVAERASRGLASAGRRAEDWDLPLKNMADLTPGLKRTYRDGRQALKAVVRHENPQTYHEFRKRVKDFWYQVRLLKELGTEAVRAEEASLKELGVWLGEDHNLAVLRERLEARPKRYGNARAVQSFLAVAAEDQHKLRENSLRAGEGLYAAKPSSFASGIEQSLAPETKPRAQTVTKGRAKRVTH